MNANPIVKYGPLAAAETAGLTGRQVLQGIIEGRFPHPPIGQALTYWLVEIGDGFAAFEGEPGEHLLNPMGGVHGGWALTLIDSATGCAALSTLPADASFATVETKGNFSRPIAKDTGRVRCEGRVIAKGRQIISAEAKLTSRDGKVLAHGTSTMMALGVK
jgi:uncharacterized protein (TIGR00369 family)